MILEVIIIEENEYEENHRQEIKCENEKLYFSVSNLCEYPEDAIIGRDLFDASDYIKALNRGIELANKGYSKVVAKENE